MTTLGEPIGSTVLAYFILRESPTWIKLGGAAMILAGIYIAFKRLWCITQEVVVEQAQ